MRCFMRVSCLVLCAPRSPLCAFYARLCIKFKIEAHRESEDLYQDRGASRIGKFGTMYNVHGRLLRDAGAPTKPAGVPEGVNLFLTDSTTTGIDQIVSLISDKECKITAFLNLRLSGHDHRKIDGVMPEQ